MPVPGKIALSRHELVRVACWQGPPRWPFNPPTYTYPSSHCAQLSHSPSEKWTKQARSLQRSLSDSSSRLSSAPGRLRASAAVAPATAGSSRAEEQSIGELATMTVDGSEEDIDRKRQRLETLTSLVREAISSPSITPRVFSSPPSNLPKRRRLPWG